MSLTFSVGEGGKVHIVRGENKKEFNKETFVGILQMVLSTIAPNRDYTSIVSINKLLKVIDLECEPDESDEESDSHETAEPVVKAVSAPTPVVASVAVAPPVAAATAESSTPAKRPAVRAGARARVAQKPAEDDDD